MSENGLTSMFGELRVGQDLFAKLEPISVLLVFVASLQGIKWKKHANNYTFTAH